MRRRFIVLEAIAALVSLSSSLPAFSQNYGGFGQNNIQLPDSPTMGDRLAAHADQKLYEQDQRRIDTYRQEEAAYKSRMDAQLADSRKALPGIENQVEKMKQKFSAPTLKKMMTDPACHYYVLMHWIEQEENLEAQENTGIAAYDQHIAQIRAQRDADRHNIGADQQIIRDDQKKYTNKAYSEQEILDRWRYKHEDHLARIQTSGYGSSALPYYDPYGGYGYGVGGYPYAGGYGVNRW